MEWTGALVGLGGLGVAALSLWLTYRERTKWYRERVYDKQLGACLAICATAAEVRSEFLNASLKLRIAALRQQEPPEGVWHVVDEARARLLRLEREWGLVLPAATSRALAAFEETATRVRGIHELLPELAPIPDGDFSAEAAQHVVAQFETLVQAARADLGTELLSGETLRLVGAASQESRIADALAKATKGSIGVASDSEQATMGAYLDALAAVFKHAVNTPLAALRTTTDYALLLVQAAATSEQLAAAASRDEGQDGSGPPAPRGNLEKALDAMHRLPAAEQALIALTHDFADDLGGLGVATMVNLPELAHEAAVLAREGLLAGRLHHISIDDETGKDVNVTVFASRLLKQHLYSLLHNSVLSLEQRMEAESNRAPGVIRIWISEALSRSAGDIESERAWALHVRDNGAGVFPEQLAELRRFKPGLRFREGTGQGMGLFAMQRYVSSLGGRVELNSEAGEYFEVVILLNERPQERPRPEVSHDESERGLSRG
jgi:C4-dicarboxylate-specific signal transduction histidine kinase